MRIGNFWRLGPGCCLMLGAGALLALSTPQTAHAVTFAEVLAAPDDADLNLKYARQQADAGDLLSAAAALERLLYITPQWDSARLFYAMVLYELDDIPAVSRELSLLEGRPLSAENQKNMQVLQNRINGKSDRSSISEDRGGLSGRIAVGLRYDDNAANALIDSLFVFSDSSDIAATFEGRLDYRSALGGDGSVGFRFGAEGQTVLHETFNNTDYAVIGGYGGLYGGSGSVDWTLDGTYQQVALNRRKYRSEIGGRASLSTEFNPTLRGSLSFSYADQDYNDFGTFLTESLRSGDRWRLEGRLAKQFSDSFSGSATISYTDKSAQSDRLAYDGFGIALSGYNRFANDSYWTGFGQYRALNFKGIDGSVIPIGNRDDDYFYLRTAFGLPLSTLSDGFSEQVSIEAGVSYSDRSSNSTFGDFNNFGGDLRLAWDF